MTEDEMVGWHHRLKEMTSVKLLEMVKERKPSMLQSIGSEGVGYN